VTDREMNNVNSSQIHTSCNHSNQIITKFLCTEHRNASTGVTSIQWGVMPTLVHKRRNSSDTENSVAIHRTTLLLEYDRDL